MTIFVARGNNQYDPLSTDQSEHEEDLKKFVFQNPKSIPLSDYSENLKLCIACREFKKIDLLGIDQDGELYLIEGKRINNTDRRAAIAQSLDYGTTIWKEYQDNPDKFIVELEEKMKHNHDLSLREKIAEDLNVDSDEIIKKLKTNVSNGKFRFVILMNELDDDVKDGIDFLNQIYKIGVFGVEIETYHDGENKIRVPKMYGFEGMQEAISPSTPHRNSFNKEDFDEEFETSSNLNQREKDAISKLLKFTKEHMNEMEMKKSWDKYFGGSGKSPIFQGFLPKFEKRAFYDLVVKDGTLHLKFWAMEENKEQMKNRFLEICLRKNLDFITNRAEGKDALWLKKEEWVPKVEQFIEAVHELIKS